MIALYKSTFTYLLYFTGELNQIYRGSKKHCPVHFTVVSTYIDRFLQYSTISSSLHQKNWLFSAPPTYYRRKQRLKCSQLVFNFPKVVQQHLVGEVGKSIFMFVAHYLNILCAKYCRNQSTYVDTTVK